MKNLAELVFIPTPGMGHLVAAVEMAKLLISRDDRLSVTILIMNIRTLSKVAAYIQTLVTTAAAEPARIKYVDLSPHNDPLTEANPGILKHRFMESLKPHVKNAVSQLVNSLKPSEPRLAGFVIDMFCTTMIDVADHFGVPTYMFYTSGVGFLGLMFYLQTLHDERGVNPTSFKNDKHTQLNVPVFLGPIPAHALPSIMIEKGWADLLIEHTRRTRETKGIMVNSFEDLETHALRALSVANTPPVYPVGPIFDFESGSSSSSGGGAVYEDIMEWLDDQPASSVVFLCFGSAGSFYEDQAREIAKALEQSGVRFLWSLRQPRPWAQKRTHLPIDYEDPSVALPEGFLERTEGKGKVIGWAPQVDVLAHKAVGGFVSHCGWNSILESLWFGVPIATWPLYGEQHMNAFQLLELGLAEKIVVDYPTDFFCNENEMNVLEAEVIESGIRRLMEQDSDVRKRVREMSEKSKKAVCNGGSSHLNLDRFIGDVLDIINVP